MLVHQAREKWVAFPSPSRDFEPSRPTSRPRGSSSTDACKTSKEHPHDVSLPTALEKKPSPTSIPRPHVFKCTYTGRIEVQYGENESASFCLSARPADGKKTRDEERARERGRTTERIRSFFRHEESRMTLRARQWRRQRLWRSRRLFSSLCPPPSPPRNHAVLLLLHPLRDCRKRLFPFSVLSREKNNLFLSWLEDSLRLQLPLSRPRRPPLRRAS